MAFDITETVDTIKTPLILATFVISALFSFFGDLPIVEESTNHLVTVLCVVSIVVYYIAYMQYPIENQQNRQEQPPQNYNPPRTYPQYRQPIVEKPAPELVIKNDVFKDFESVKEHIERQDNEHKTIPK